ncbi:uncharacterized protein LOC106168622 [Lingula anatina]|uniref:Uncharacterized protein LOC106168622 n=1 Tax=Lingula anatina TaxID=7574 RepID=A0A1S3IYE3_LINAN|nr:uncharacterized protein LOC106168622 [Lingula anatina]|eukprot:XP_013403222.1 uncharacterized protein LOC106168622 [Lingula anatina]
MVDTGSTVKAVSDANMAVILGGVLGSISFIAVTLIVVAAIIHVLHWKSKQKKRKNQYLESNLAPRLSKTSHLGYVCAQNTDVLRGDRYIGNPTAIGRDNQGYQSSTERYDRGSKYQQNNRHQPAYKIGRQIYIPPPDY